MKNLNEEFSNYSDLELKSRFTRRLKALELSKAKFVSKCGSAQFGSASACELENLKIQFSLDCQSVKQLAAEMAKREIN